MKKLFLSAITLFCVSIVVAQSTEEVTKKNSWLKAGVSVGVPVGDLADYSSFAAGIELSGQLMRTKNFGIGISTGYTNFFAKDDFESFGAIPLGAMFRYYPKYKGFFAGVDVGYTFLTNVDDAKGGAYVKPQLGYHNYDWNIYGFYNQVFRNEGAIDLQTVGIAATYNIRFK